MKIISPTAEGQNGFSATSARTPEAIWAHLTEHVMGKPVPVTDSEIAQATDWPKVRKYYRLNGVPALEKVADKAEHQRKMEQLAIMGMALRGL